MTQIHVHCLGVFREIGDGFDVDVPSNSVDAIRGAVAEHLLRLGRSDLNDVLKRSVFAEGDELLKDHMVVESSAVNVLPPVAGG